MPQKRLAILLFGLSYVEKYWQWYSKRDVKIDYRLCYENHQKFIVKYFKSLGYEIDFFLSTNDSKMKNQIIKDYNPKGTYFGDLYSKGDNRKNRNYRVMKGIELILNYSNKNKIKYDNVLATRFDLEFQEDFSKSNILLDRFNLVSQMEKVKRICDNFYLLPGHMLEKFYKITVETLNMNAHCIRWHFENQNIDLYYFKNEKTYVHLLSFYKIKRQFI